MKARRTPAFAALAADGSPSWPLDHVKAAAASATGAGERARCVLLTTGAMSPCHHGHAAMLCAARAALEAKGYHVLGGFLSPSHDLYAGPKAASLGTPHAGAAHRVAIGALVAAECSEHPWLRVATWEARQEGR